MSVTKTAHLVPTLCVGTQAGRSASGCPQEDCFRQPETGRGASRLHSHAERGNEELFYFGYTHFISAL
ncbi:MAG: hypothetical protein GY749_04410, partial [Desulfobacteraceae bacterium]|nr:hypothetical protein [Desulfobacteraceae bacterium]